MKEHIHGGNMTLGTPVLLSVKENKLKTTLLSRVAMRNDGTEGYKEELLQELILGGHLKTGQSGSPQNRPVERV
jgi:hypothetical protein